VLRTVEATRYVTPLREGGSLPAVVEADDLGTYVLKFRGAGQGRKALVAEILAGEIARTLGLLVPEIVLVNLDPELARAEPDAEIQDLIRASAGLNLALDYLPGSLGFDPLVEPPGSGLASRILWFDALVTNVDRTPRNPNLLTWHNRLWLIDHGASLYFHHTWKGWREASMRPFAAARDHVLLPFARAIAEADATSDELGESSWGAGGGHFTWLIVHTQWMWRLIDGAERRMEALVAAIPADASSHALPMPTTRWVGIVPLRSAYCPPPARNQSRMEDRADRSRLQSSSRPRSSSSA
jgi:hypothetical protein